jgi:peptide/nickel transport system substrate-binding protein
MLSAASSSLTPGRDSRHARQACPTGRSTRFWSDQHVHREYFYSGGAFRAGPPIPAVEELIGRFVAQIDGERLQAVAAEIDRFVYDEALAVFLCAPMALYAVNRHVNFTGHAATFELAETEADQDHWSRRA